MKVKVLLFTCLALVPGLALPIYSPRAMAMGGAYVALSDDEASIYYNPAGMAAARDYFACVPNFSITADDRITEDFNTYIELKDAIWHADVGEGDLDPLTDAIDETVSFLAGLAENPPGVTGYLNYGIGVMLGPLAVSWIGGGTAQVLLEPDTNLGRMIPDMYLMSYESVALLYLAGYLDSEQLVTLWPTYPDPDGFIGDTEGNGIGLTENQTGALLTNDARQEFIVSYAEFLWRSGRRDRFFVSAGINIKYMVTQAYRNRFTAADDGMHTTGPGWIIEQVLGTRPILGHAVSADLGLLGQFTPYLRLGVLVRDVIPAPISWDEPVPGVPTRLEPHWRIGVASQVVPDMLTLAVDVDLQESEGLFSAQQDLSVGARVRFNDALWAAAGFRYNLADETQPPLYHLGLGMHLNGIRFDLAVGLGKIDTSGEANTYFSASGAMGFSL
ncbi:conjugal transfer protein TraF [bacterium]|nr:conjugal transfer protein TraF [bacterium]